jgi:polyisoprenoid-binding protein YceI
MKKTLIAMILAAAVLALPAAAEEWKLDPNHSRVKFAIEAKLFGAEGIFHTVTVKDDINEKALEQSKFEMTIDINSLDTANARRDEDIKKEAFFDVAKYPTATIAVKSIRKIGENNYEGDAELTLHGVTKPVKLPAQILLHDGGRLRFRGSLQINRQDYGISGNSGMNHIEDIATISYELNLQKPRSGGPPK